MSKDLFSSHANQYAAFRPTYPKELYDFIFSHVKGFDSAWDAGTGNGQVARDLSTKFKNVFATDISDKQIENAYQSENIFYSVATETTSFKEKSFNLICIAQAIHWFDRAKFYEEVKRVAKPEAMIAVWGYGLLNINSEIDLHVSDFYRNIVGTYWDKERKLIDEKYKTISFPFHEIKVPSFGFSFQWTTEQLQGYLTTWSSVQKYIKANGFNPVDNLMQKIKPLWSTDALTVGLPLFLRLAKIN